MPVTPPASGGGGASAITIKDEGVALTTAAASLDFVGAGVTASGTTDAKTITIPGGSNQLGSITAASAAIAATETVVASASLAAGYMTAGMTFRLRAAGVGTTGLTPGADTFRIRIGTTTLTGNVPTSVAPTANASVTAQAFSFEAIVTVRTTGATGSIIGECHAEGDDIATGLFTMLQDLSATVATVAVDTTVANLLELTFQSGAADSTCTFHVAPIEVLSSGAAATKPPGYEFSYVEFTAAVPVSATTEATADTVVTSAAVTYDGSTAVAIEFFANDVIVSSAAATNSISIWLYDGASSIGQLGFYRRGVAVDTNSPTHLARRLTPSAASHTYSIRASRGGANGSINAGAGGSGAVVPGFIRITKV